MKKPYIKPSISKIVEGMPSKFGFREMVDPITEIDGIPVEELIKEYGSPLFVLSERTIREVYRQAYMAFSTRYPKVQFAWSYKTNYLDAVCRVYHQEGAWAEVVSGFEYDKALRNGVPGDKIIFNGPDKTREDLAKAIKNRSLIHIDHFDELYTILSLTSELEERPQVAIRVNMDTGIYPQWDRFGFNYENGEAWTAITRIMMSDKMDLVGLHTHIGTYIMSPKPYGIAAHKLAQLAKQIEEKWGHRIGYIDLGGGFASRNTLRGAYLSGKDTTPSFEQYADAISQALIETGFDAYNLPTLFLETGRALIDDAGYLLGTVIANKRLADGKRAMIIDIGVNLLFTAFWYEHELHPAKPVPQYLEDTTVYGPLCMNIDVIRANVKFPVLEPGDHVVIKRVGAYNMTQWLQFINLRPYVVMIDLKGNVHVIREKETLEYLTSLEKVPEHLKDIGFSDNTNE